MKIFLAASSNFWAKLPEVKAKLEALGHEVMLPSTVDDPDLEKKSLARKRQGPRRVNPQTIRRQRRASRQMV